MSGVYPTSSTVPTPVIPIKPTPVSSQMNQIIIGKDLEIDVSHYEPLPDYKAMMKEGKVKRVYVKATEHAVDSMLVQHVKAAQAAGFPVGAYHFMHASEAGLPQASRYLAAISSLKLELPHCLDWEGGSADGMSSPHQQQVAAEWIDYVERVTGSVVEIYTGESFMNELQVDHRFARNPLWLAHYQTVITRLHIPKPWVALQGWQFTDAYSVAGLATGHHVDASWVAE